MPEQKKPAEMVPPSAATKPAATFTAPADRALFARRMFGPKPTALRILNAKRVLTVLHVTDASGAKVTGEPEKGAFQLALIRKSDGRTMHELLALCHALWPDATVTAKEG